VAVVVDQMEVVPAEPPPQSEPVAAEPPGLPAQPLHDQVRELLRVRAARAERLRAD
jgi:hypothetical protein